MGKLLLEFSYSSDYEVGWANDILMKSRIQVTMRWDGQTTLTNSYSRMISYSSDYEVGWANMRWDKLRSLVFK